jgi:hypothetical protein
LTSLRFWIPSHRFLLRPPVTTRSPVPTTPWQPPPPDPPLAAGRGLWIAASTRQRAVPPLWRPGAGSAAPWSASRPRSPTRSYAASLRVAFSSPPSSSKPAAPLSKLVLVLRSKDARRPDKELWLFFSFHFSLRRSQSPISTHASSLSAPLFQPWRSPQSRGSGQGFPCDREAGGTDVRSDFEVGELFGVANFRHGFLAREKNSSQIVALKVLFKSQLKQSQVQHLLLMFFTCMCTSITTPGFT